MWGNALACAGGEYPGHAGGITRESGGDTEAAVITAEERDKILAAKDPRELVDVLEVAMNEFLDFLQSAGIATLLVYEIDEKVR